MTQVYIGRITYGRDAMDWGAQRRLLCASPDQDVLLFIREGHAVGMGLRGLGRTYQPTALILQDKRRPGQHGQIQYLATGRISNSTLRDHSVEINEAFGRQVAAALDVRKTYWLTEIDLVEASGE